MPAVIGVCEAHVQFLNVLIMNHQKSGPAETVPTGLAPTPMIGASLSKPHTAELHCKTHVYI